MGMRAVTDERGVRIWVDTKSQYPRYSFSISKKNDNGEYDNFYMEVKFEKSLPKPDNGDDILIKDAFLTFSTWKDKEGHKRTSPYLMVLDYENMDPKKAADIVSIPDGLEEALPFK